MATQLLIGFFDGPVALACRPYKGWREDGLERIEAMVVDLAVSRLLLCWYSRRPGGWHG